MLNKPPGPGAGVSGRYYYYQSDHLNTPRIMTDRQQKVVWQGVSQAFGVTTVTVDEVENNLRFPGQYYDAGMGTHYNYFRDYDPRVGRYLQSDPIGLRGGVNTYAYVENNPFRYIDPLGLVKCKCTATSGGQRDPGSVKNGMQEKICTYKCFCDCKQGAITITFSAGFSGLAECIGQTTPLPHHTQPGPKTATFDSFKFDTESIIDRFSLFTPPTDFMNKVEGECPGC